MAQSELTAREIAALEVVDDGLPIRLLKQPNGSCKPPSDIYKATRSDWGFIDNSNGLNWCVVPTMAAVAPHVSPGREPTPSSDIKNLYPVPKVSAPS